jgi:hypothetical protein
MLRNLTLVAVAVSLGAALIAPTAALARMGGMGGHGVSNTGHIDAAARVTRIDSPRIEVHPRITPSPKVEKSLFCQVTKDGGYHHNGCTPWN